MLEGWKAGRLEGWEAGRLGGWEAGRLMGCGISYRRNYERRMGFGAA